MDPIEALEGSPILDYRGKPRVQTINTEPSMTVQSDAHKADIKEILKKYKSVGIVEHLNESEAQYADISQFTDYADAVRNVKLAEREFLELPSKVREIFNHDVSNWLDTAHDPDKRQALIDAGYIDAPAAPEPPPAVEPPPVAPPPTDPVP